MINKCGFFDLGFNGPRFTSCNKREPQYQIWERLDLALANAEWFKLYENFRVQHLDMIEFDHRPLLLDTEPIIRSKGNFHFQAMWI